MDCVLFPRNTWRSVSDRVHPAVDEEARQPEIPAESVVLPQPFSTTYDRPQLAKSFPTFWSQEHVNRYNEWQRENIRFLPLIFSLLTIGVPNMGTRYNWMSFGWNENLWNMAAQLFAVPLNALIVLHMVVNHFALKYPKAKREGISPKQKWWLGWCDWTVKQLHLEDLLIVGGVVANTATFLARVTAGQCPDTSASSIWLSQGCNPVAKCHSFPHDAVLMLLLPPLMLQCLWRGMNYHLVMCAYLVGAAAIAYAIYVTDGAIQMYTLLYTTGFMVVSHEVERFMRSMFIAKMMLAESSNRQLVLQGEKGVLLAQEATREREIREENVARIKREAEHEKQIQADKQALLAQEAEKDKQMALALQEAEMNKDMARREEEQMRSTLGNMVRSYINSIRELPHVVLSCVLFLPLPACRPTT